MSRVYRIRVAESVRRHIHIEDGIRGGLELLDVLPRGEMAGLLRAALEGRGFESRADGTVQRVEVDGTVVTVDPQAASVDVRLAADRDVTAEADRELHVEGPERTARAHAQARVRSELEATVDQAESDLRRRVTETLEGRLAALRPELDTVVNRVVADALKIRARQLGEVVSIDDRLEEGSVTIKVKL